MKAAWDEISKRAEGRFHLRDLGCIGFDQSGVFRKPLRRQVQVGGRDMGVQTCGDGSCRCSRRGTVNCHYSHHKDAVTV